MKKQILVLILLFTVGSCTDLEEELYSGVDRNNFYNNKEEVTAGLLRVYEHGAWFYRNWDLFVLEELPADQLVITQKGGHWFDQGKFIRYHRHEWTSEEPEIYGAWSGAWIGISLANTLIEELAELNYSEIPGGLTVEDQEQHIAEMHVLRATYYYHLLSLFGDVPISESAHGDPPDPSSRAEVFDWVTQDLEESLEKLPRETYKSARGRLNQGAAQHLLARFYLNSEVWTGEPRYAEVEQITRSLVNGEFGNFELDDTFYGPFVHNNGENSNEILFGFPRDRVYTGSGLLQERFYHYQTPQIFGTGSGGNNGIHLQPSRMAPEAGTHYTQRTSQPYYIPEEDYEPEELDHYQWEKGLGSPYEQFHDDDLRKKDFNFGGDVGIDNKDFDIVEGMFLHGIQDSPITGELATSTEEYTGETLVHVDFVARAASGNSNSATSEGEENTGVRLVKYPVYPEVFDGSSNNDWVEYRLAEAYYMLAESLIRQNKPGAAEYVNEVKQRNYDDYSSHAYSDAELDLPEMLAEWGREFLGEHRRRTDLIRFNKLTAEWWDKDSSQDHRKLYPYPSRVLNSNPNLEQNTGY
ncbi:MAG: RagB/SusD family nutrient uptake outer membrane protein [Balneolales bacterium]